MRLVRPEGLPHALRTADLKPLVQVVHSQPKRLAAHPVVYEALRAGTAVSTASLLSVPEAKAVVLLRPGIGVSRSLRRTRTAAEVCAKDPSASCPTALQLRHATPLSTACMPVLLSSKLCVYRAGARLAVLSARNHAAPLPALLQQPLCLWIHACVWATTICRTAPRCSRSPARAAQWPACAYAPLQRRCMCARSPARQAAARTKKLLCLQHAATSD